MLARVLEDGEALAAHVLLRGRDRPAAGPHNRLGGLYQRHEGDAGLGERVEEGDDLTQRAAEPGDFADDQAVAVLAAVQQLVEPASLLGSLPGGGRLDEVVDAEVVLARVLGGWRGAGCARPAARSRPSGRRRFSRPVHGMQRRLLYRTVIDHGTRCVPCC